MPTRFNVKCEPELAIQLREKHSFIMPGYHMNKKHWNTIELLPHIPDTDIQDWVKHSYNAVRGKK